MIHSLTTCCLCITFTIGLMRFMLDFRFQVRPAPMLEFAFALFRTRLSFNPSLDLVVAPTTMPT